MADYEIIRDWQVSLDSLKLESKDIDSINEETGEKIKEKKYYFKGTVAKGDFLNENKRSYPWNYLKRAVESVQEAINEGSMVGEIEHPTTRKVNLERAAVKIEKLVPVDETKEIYGEMKIMDTHYGKHLQQLIKEGIKLGVSTRGKGRLISKGNGIYEVADNYELITIDVVHRPSAGTRPEVVNEDINEEVEGVSVRSILDEIFYLN